MAQPKVSGLPETQEMSYMSDPQHGSQLAKIASEGVLTDTVAPPSPPLVRVGAPCRASKYSGIRGWLDAHLGLVEAREAGYVPDEKQAVSSLFRKALMISRCVQRPRGTSGTRLFLSPAQRTRSSPGRVSQSKTSTTVCNGNIRHAPSRCRRSSLPDVIRCSIRDRQDFSLRETPSSD